MCSRLFRPFWAVELLRWSVERFCPGRDKMRLAQHNLTLFLPLQNIAPSARFYG